MAPGKKRLDLILVERGLAPTRAKAQSMILAGLVYAGTQRLDKAGAPYDESLPVEVRGREHPYVSRGGVKLAAALVEFAVGPEGKTALDVGASTGGFTDCLLQGGAKSVVALDVGKGQMDWKLRSDPRVKLEEGFNARNLSPENVAGPFDLAVIDVSFISLALVLPRVATVLTEGGVVISLVKPQFEAGRGEVGKGGVVRDAGVMERAVDKVVAVGESSGLIPLGRIESPITGAKGNREFFAAFLNPPKGNKLLVPRGAPFPRVETVGTTFYPIVDRAASLAPLIRAGVKYAQLRVKDLAGERLEHEIIAAIKLAREGGCALFINDYWELATRHGAYGVHLGQEDVVGADVDAIQKAGLRLGVSAHDHLEGAVARALRPSYVAFGPIFFTKLKAMRFAPQGVEKLRAWVRMNPFPVVAIGGITLENAPEVLTAKPAFISVVGDVANSPDPEGRAREWAELLKKSGRP